MAGTAAKRDEQKLELKICDRCGGLFLRPVETSDVFCAPCKAIIEGTKKEKR